MTTRLELGTGGKDLVLIASAAELATPSTVTLPEPEPAPGLLLPDGSINWGCPCLGGMATGPCGPQFREAFTCFHYSEAEPKGSECYEKFSVMQECMGQYPELYGRDDEEAPLPPGALSGEEGAPVGVEGAPVGVDGAPVGVEGAPVGVEGAPVGVEVSSVAQETPTSR